MTLRLPAFPALSAFVPALPLLAALLAVAPASATPVLYVGSETRGTAWAFDGGAGNVFANGSVLPASLGAGSVTRIAGQSAVTTAYDYSLIGDDVTLAHTFDHRIASAAPGSLSGSSIYQETAWSYGSVIFTLEAGDIGYTYTLDGRLEQQGTSRLYLQSNLIDMTSGQVFQGHGDRNPSTDGYLQTGETSFTHTGSLSGALIAGHMYQFYYSAMTQHFTPGNDPYTNPFGYTPTTAQGHLTLTLAGPAAPVAAIPEPGTLALFGLGLGGLALAWRRRK